MRVIQYLICSLLLGLLLQVDFVIASDSDTEPVLIYIDPVTGKYRIGSPLDAAVTSSADDTETAGVSMNVEILSHIRAQRMVIIGIIMFAWLLIAPRLIHKNIFQD